MVLLLKMIESWTALCVAKLASENYEQHTQHYSLASSQLLIEAMYPGFAGARQPVMISWLLLRLSVTPIRLEKLGT